MKLRLRRLFSYGGDVQIEKKMPRHLLWRSFPDDDYNRNMTFSLQIAIEEGLPATTFGGLTIEHRCSLRCNPA